VLYRHEIIPSLRTAPGKGSGMEMNGKWILNV
jgi:hypothetical protein